METPVLETKTTTSVSTSPVSSLRSLWLGLLYLAIAAYLYSFSEYGLNVWDEGGYANGTLRTLNGEKAMVDFNPSGYLPGRYIYGALFFKLFGINIESLRIGVILITPAMIFMVYAISRRMMPPGFAFIAAAFMFSAPAMYYNRFFTFFCVLNLYCLVRCVERIQPQRYLYLAGAILLSGFFKFEVALFSFLCSAMVFLIQFFLLRKKQQNLFEAAGSDSSMGRTKLWFGAGLMVAVLFLALSFLLKKDFFSLAVDMVLGFHQAWGNPFPDLFPGHELGVHELFQRSLFYIPGLVYLGLTSFLLIKIVRGDSFKVIDLYALSILFIGVCAYGLVIWRAGFDNLLRTLPPAYILFCYILYLAHGRLLSLTEKLSRGPDILKIGRKTAINVVIVFLPFLFF